MKNYLRGLKYFLQNYFFNYIPSYFIRNIFLSLCGLKNLENISIQIGVKILGPAKDLSIGDETIINPECLLDARGGLKIGKNCSISRGVNILTMSHDYESKGFELKGGMVHIQNNVWVGINSIILPGCNIGDNSILGAGSILTKSIPNGEFWAGNPAKFIKKLSQNERESVFYKPPFSSQT